MIFRKIITSFQKQDWLTFLLETLIVVFGVFIALQANNWNTLRVERLDEHAALLRLNDDYTSMLAYCDEQIAYMQRVNPKVVEIVSYFGNDTDKASKETIVELLEDTFHLPAPPDASDAHTELVTSGRMNLLSNPALRGALASHSAVAHDFRFGQQAGREWGRPYIMPLVKFSILVETFPLDQALTKAGTRSDLLVATRVRQDVFLGHLAGLEALREATAKVHSLLQSELDRF